MDVENTLRESLNEGGREQAHVPGKADEIDPMLAQCRDDGCIVLGALAAICLDS